jgi:hypothetical protein
VAYLFNDFFGFNNLIPPKKGPDETLNPTPPGSHMHVLPLSYSLFCALCLHFSLFIDLLVGIKPKPKRKGWSRGFETKNSGK